MARKTEQRRWIRHVFQTTERPLTPQEVLTRAQRHISGLGIATVYRNLKSFNEEGWLKAVELPAEPTRYELADLDYHHHFQCDDCGRVYNIPGSPNDMASLYPENYQVSRHQVLLYGQCAECTAEATTHHLENAAVASL